MEIYKLFKILNPPTGIESSWLSLIILLRDTSRAAFLSQHFDGLKSSSNIFD